MRSEVLAVGERGIVTDAEGNYRFWGLPPGPGYRVRATLPGYAQIEFSDMTLGEGDLRQDIVLRLASEVQETVRVRGHTDAVKAESVTTSTTFTSTFISGLPILGRDYQDILTLAPGVTDVNHTGNVNIHGARDTDVVTLVDGVSTTDPLTGYYGQNLNIESLQEIEVITSGATAEFSRAQGGFANIGTKSGNNEFSGTFKLFVRSNRLDGDGAGIDPPELGGGFGGAESFRELSFTDLKPFLSFSGPIVKDRLWYYLSNEYIQVENPVSTLSQAFVTRTVGYREFGKISWQMKEGHRLSFSTIFDMERQENQGIDSLTDVEAGYTAQRGGLTLTLKEMTLFSPSQLLDSSASWFDNSHSTTPTTDPDTNGNGVLYVDKNHDGVYQAHERDAGEDWDLDGRYDIYEPEDVDLDGDERIRSDLRYVVCEGWQNEDLNCDGALNAEVDLNMNNLIDPEEDVGIPCVNRDLCPDGIIPGTAHNLNFDTEDSNGNGRLDVVGDSGYTPYPFWEDRNENGVPETAEFQAPFPPDRDHYTDREGRTTGPYPYEQYDHRKRFTLKEDFSAYLADALGTHELKMGLSVEYEGYDQESLQRARLFFPIAGRPGRDRPEPGGLPQVVASLAIPSNATNTARGDNFGFYLSDTYKPLPNLTLGLGVRVDFENIRSKGFTAFDPRVERRAYDGILDFLGFDSDPYDSITNVGLCGDPLHSCHSALDLSLAGLQSTLLGVAYRNFTRHNLDIAILRALGTAAGGLPDPNEVMALGLRRRQPEDFRITNANLAPRISVSWDPLGDGNSKAFASWGRYYDKLFLGTVVLEEGPDAVSRAYIFDPTGYDSDGEANYRLGNVISQSPHSIFQVDRDLATPYADEWTAGVQLEVAPELSVGLRYIRRDYRDQLQDIDINHHLKFDPLTGQPVDRLGSMKCTPRLCENYPDGLADLYIESVFFNRIHRLGNYNSQTYRAWELELVRRLSRKWQMEASYTHSVAWGDAESYLSRIGNDPSLAEYEKGFLDYDQRHVIKLNAIAYLPRSWLLGGTAEWSSGLPFSAVMGASSYDDAGYTQDRTLYGRLLPSGLGFTRESRNIHRNKATYLFNTRLQKFFVLGKVSASAFFEVFNLLNADTLRIYYLRQVPPTLSENDTDGTIVHPGTERIVGTRDFGRRFQVGIQIDF